MRWKIMMMAGGLMMATSLADAAPVQPVSGAEAEAWCRWLIPLPHEIAITGCVSVAPAGIGVRGQARTAANEPAAGAGQSGADDAEKTAIAEFTEFVKSKTGVEPSGDRFIIQAGTIGKDNILNGVAIPGAYEQLAKLPNNEQAYLIVPLATDTLAVAALRGPGVYYGLATLRQLLAPRLDSTNATIPLVTIKDWPDIKERGIWGGWTSAAAIRWMAERKLNYLNYGLDYGRLGLTRGSNGPICEIKLNMDLWHYARRHALNYKPHITHLDWMTDREHIRAAYPELIFKEEGQKQGRGGTSPCTSNPILQQILTGWMKSIASQGVDEMGVWTTEYYGHCLCPACKDKNQIEEEAKVIVAAWREAKKTYPDLRLRVFTSINDAYFKQGLLPADTCEKFIKQIPKNVIIERACGSTARDKDGLMIDPNPEFNELPAKGYTLASYRSSLNYFAMRYSLDSYQHFFKSLVKHGWIGGYAWEVIPLNIYLKELGQCQRVFDDVQMDALAEWSWNNTGRTEKEFAVAFAARSGYRHPEKFGEWAGIMPGYFALNFATELDALNRAKAGQRRIPSDAEYSGLLAKCAQGMKLAEEIGDPGWILESKLIAAKIRLDKVLYGTIIKDIVKHEADAQILKTDLAAFKQSASDFSDLLKERDAYYGIKDERFTGWPMGKFTNYVNTVKSMMGASRAP